MQTLQLAPVAACPICHHPSADGADREEVLGGLELPNDLLLNRCPLCEAVYLAERHPPEAIAGLEDASAVYDHDPGKLREWLAGLDKLVESFEAHTPRVGRMLDFGCNRGLLMEAARRRGWDVVGVEISAVAADAARADFGLTVHGDLSAVPAEPDFDLAVMWHVLEHTYDPVGVLMDLRRRLRPDGLLAVQVPSYSSIGEFVRRDILPGIICAVHTVYFTRASLAEALDRAGLELVMLYDAPDDIMLSAFARPLACP